MLSFNNTEYAFAYKSTKELKKARFLFSLMGNALFVRIGLMITPIVVKWKLPFIQTIIRNTIFKQFVGGETLSETAKVVDKLRQHNVQVILDYGIEGGNNGEAGFDASTESFIQVINYAAMQKNIPFISIKITGIARFSLLEKIDSIMNESKETLMERYLNALENLSQQEKKEWSIVCERMYKISETAAAKNIGVLVDAEETWIQNPVDALTILMMAKFNHQQIVVFNTIQLYRHGRKQFLKDCYTISIEKDFILGIKLVRGAYMEKERKRAQELNYVSPIQPDKAACDLAYNESIAFCIDHLQTISLIVASHNEASNMLATILLQQKNIPFNHRHIHFSQLYGMSDHITFNLAKAGCSVSKYLPFGPIGEVVPYLMRRAEENSSVSGQTGRELLLIKKELKRRMNEE
ncbi:MAG: proline dehydrogenase family protein [Ferruginibacter sp.]